MTVSEAIQNRRSIRAYKSGVTMPQEDIEKLLEAAMLAPSACNTRPWEFVVLKSEEAKQRAMSIHTHARHLATASVGIIVCARPDLQVGISNGFFPQDCGAAVENILLEAMELGYGTCWCGIHPREELVAAFRKEFSLSSLPFALITVGVPDADPAKKGFYDPERVTVL